MSNLRTFLVLGFSALAASLPLAAQPAASYPAPAASAAAPAYQSAFEGYRPFEDGKVQDWRKSNDTVREIGGWRAYAREMRGGAQAPASGASAPHRGSSQPEPAAVDPHAGHKP